MKIEGNEEEDPKDSSRKEAPEHRIGMPATETQDKRRGDECEYREARRMGRLRTK